MITAILNLYRRPQNLLEQIKRINEQSIKPQEIWIWKNYHEDLNEIAWDNFKRHASDSGIKIFDCNHNWKYCGRFAAACLVDTEYVAIFDDDTMPGNKWFENCLNTHKKTPGIMGTVGVNIHNTNTYQPNTRYGWVSGNEDTVEVDLVGHAWFFPSEYIKYMWMEKPMWENGEDMHFSAMSQIHGGIKTYVPPHPKGNKELWGSIEGIKLGVDDVASSAVRNHFEFYKQRNECVKRLYELGWNTVLGGKNA